MEDGGILDDEMFQWSADHLQTRLHVAAGGDLIALLHLFGAARRAFGLTHLQIGTWQRRREGEEPPSVHTARHN